MPVTFPSMRHRSAALLLAALACASPAAAGPREDLQRLMDDYYRFLLRENPTEATGLGVRDYDNRLADISLAAEDRRAAQAAAFLARVEAIPAGALDEAGRANRSILRRSLATTIEANRYPQRMILFTTYWGWHQGFASLAGSMPFRTKADYDSYLARIAGYPRYNDMALAITAKAVAGGYVQPCSVLGNYIGTISGVIATDPTRSRFYEPFTRPRPAAIGAGDYAAMQARARDLILRVLNPAYAKHAAFFRDTYLPNCARSDSVSAQPGGRDYYAFRVRQETTTDLTPDAIHAIGLADLKRIHPEMDRVSRKAGFKSRAGFIRDLRTNPNYYPRSADELLAASALVAKTVDGKMPTLFGRLPRLPYGVRPIPAETAGGTTPAYYGPGSVRSGVAGTYFVNTAKLDQRPLWEVPALTMHEAVPGHHHQIALQQELDLPAFRRDFTSFTVFTEGWGLYAESLGEEMGLYDTPAKKMGQLSYQAWRSARLVVDTGIHAKGWTKAQAVAFMRANTALTEANIDSEVNRYISWPGQALAYKIGELKIRELRARAEKALGTRFDIRRFHDAVIGQGSLPLDALEAQIDSWIDAERTRR